MKKCKMRALSFVIVMFLLVGFAGCKQESDADRKPGKSASSQTNPDSSPEDSKAPVTLTVQGLFDGAPQDGVQKDDVSKYIADETGVTLKLMNLTDDDTAAQKLSAQVASDDLPDIFRSPSLNRLPDLIEADKVLPLDDLIEEHAKNTNTDKLAKAMIEINKVNSPDGKLYCIGMDRGTWDDGTGGIRNNYIRWDLYKKLGYPEIKNLDDLADVLIQMQKLEPKTGDGKKTYAAGSNSDAFHFAALVGNMLNSGYAEASPDHMFLIDIENNEVQETNMLTETDSLYWKSLRFLNRLNQAGAFDPDSFTQSNYSSKVNSGIYMMTQESWSASDANHTFKTNGTPERGFVALPASMFGYRNTALYYNDLTGERSFSISKKCEHPERAVELLDFLSTYEFSRIANNGLEGTNWNMKDGKPAPKEEYLNQAADDKSYISTGAGKYTHFCGYKSGTIDPDTNVSVDCRKNALPLTPTQQDFVDHFGKKSLPDVYKDGLTTYENNTIVDFGLLPEDLKLMETNLSTYLNQNEAKVIQAKNDKEFEKLQAGFIKGLGDYQIDKIFKTYYDNAVASTSKLKEVYENLD